MGEMDSNLANALADLLSRLQPVSGPADIVSPSDFISDAFGGVSLDSDQQDAHEFILAMLSALQGTDGPQPVPSTSSPVDYSRLHPWEGVQEDRIVCVACKTVSSQRLSIFSVLTVPPAASVQSTIDSIKSLERLEGYRCESCAMHTTAVKQTAVVRWPRLLFLHVNRTAIRDGQLVKDNRPMELTPVLSTGHSLRAFVQHCGNRIGAGHYVTWRRAGRRHYRLMDDAKSSTMAPLSELDLPYLLLFEK